MPEAEQGLLFADLDFSLIAIAKSAADPVGHYARPDVFRLQVNRGANPRIIHSGIQEPGPAPEDVELVAAEDP